MRKNIINLIGLLVFGLVVGTVMGKIEKNNSPPKVITGDYQKYIENPKYNIKLFGVNKCVFCKRLKDYLEQNEISYIYANVKENTDSKMQFQELGGTAFPLTIIGNSLIQGFNQDIIKTELIKSGYKIK